MLSWSSAAWKSSWRLAEEIGGGSGGRSDGRLDWGCWSGEFGSGNFHWVKLWEVEEEDDDSESGCEGRWSRGSDGGGGGGGGCGGWWGGGAWSEGVKGRVGG